MPNPIKAFFEKKKAEAKFKMAGPGQKLGDAAQAQQTASSKREAALAAMEAEKRAREGRGAAGGGPSVAQQQAAQAALARMSKSERSDFEKNRSQAVIRAMAQKELEEQKKADSEIQRLKDTYGEKKVVDVDASPLCPGVFFHCPLIGPEVLPKEQMRQKIRDFLYEQLENEKGLTACLIIRTFAKDSEKAKMCIETLCKYLDNIIQNPEEEKYRKIRKGNKVYAEKVAVCEGHDYFLTAAGFDSVKIDDQDYWLLSGELTAEQLETIKALREALVNSEPIRAELDRGLKVLLPQQASRHFDLPPDFFALSVDELKREQQARTEMLEREGMLRTKAMREREEQREKRRYRYTLIRVRFPNGLVLQGTFSVHESYRCVHDFVTECLEHPLPFVLYETSHRLEVSDYDKSLLELNLVPSAILTFAWHPEVADEISQQLGPQANFLKDEVRALVRKE